MKKTNCNVVSLILILTMAANILVLSPVELGQAQGATTTFTSGETININSNNYIDFWSNVSMLFTSGIQIQFIEIAGNGVLEPCDVIHVVFPPGFILEPCSWWEVLDPAGNPTPFEFHIDDQQYGPAEFHVDMVWPGPFPLPVPGGINFAEKKIAAIAPCDYYVVEWPVGWYPAPCSWWEIIDPETDLPTGYEFHVDWTNESCEFHIDYMIPGPYTLVFPWRQIEARRKITQISTCDWYTILTGSVPAPCSWWEILYQGQPTGKEFHVDESIPASLLFHVDMIVPDPLNIAPTYPVNAREKIDTIELCTWLKVVDPASTPQPCTCWKVILPNIGDYEFHVDVSNQDGTFHVDGVYPGPISISPASDTVLAEKKIATIEPCDWFEIRGGQLPTPCSWWRITSPPEWAGVTFHVDSNDGLSFFHIDSVDTLPAGPTPPPWSVTAEEIDMWFWKGKFVDYAPSGMPDFDERQWGTYIWQYLGAWSHCGPVAVANSLWWLDSEFEPNPIAPPTVNDGFPLVSAFGAWDDHSSQNVVPLVEKLAWFMDTDGRLTGLAHKGTSAADMEAGIAHYLSWSGVNPQGDANGDGRVNMLDVQLVGLALGSVPGAPNWNMAADLNQDNIVDPVDQNIVATHFGQIGLFYEHPANQPEFEYIEQEVERCQDVVLSIGYWVWTGSTWYREDGHFVTVAGVDSTDLKIAVSDPIRDAFENGLIAEGRIPTPHLHMPPEPPYTTHNDAAYVSQDIYSVVPVPPAPPGLPGKWALANFPPESPGFIAVIEDAIITSPLGAPNLVVDSVSVINQGCTVYAGDCYADGVTAYSVPVNVTVKNVGTFIANAFNVSLTSYSKNASLTEDYLEWRVFTLAAGENVNLTYSWHPLHTGNYSLTAVVDCHSEVCESNETDNTLAVTDYPVALMGDLNGDHINDILDITQVGLAWHSHPGDPIWNIQVDLNHDGYINILDIVRVTLYWHQTW